MFRRKPATFICILIDVSQLFVSGEEEEEGKVFKLLNSDVRRLFTSIAGSALDASQLVYQIAGS